MKGVLFSLLLVLSCSVSAQLHNRMVKFNAGISSEQLDIRKAIKTINDTSALKFNFVSQSPVFAYSHEYIFGELLSVSGRAGFQYFNIFYNNTYYGSPYVFVSLNPQLSLFYNQRFEYYIKLQLGISYYFNNPELLNEMERRILPERARIFTGVTIGGFNYYLTDRVGLNLELSIWSPELLTAGVSYRFFKGEVPTIQELQGF